MSRSDNRTLINRGRKSGLRTSEIYGALTTRLPQAADLGADSNGFVPTFDGEGHVTWREIQSPQRKRGPQ